MFLQQLIASLNSITMPSMPNPSPALNPKYWQFLGETSEPRKYTRCDARGRVYHLKERPVKVFTYCDRDSRYDGEALRAIRKKNGVGRPPKNRRLH